MKSLYARSQCYPYAQARTSSSAKLQISFRFSLVFWFFFLVFRTLETRKQGNLQGPRVYTNYGAA